MNVQSRLAALEGAGRHPALETLAVGRPDRARRSRPSSPGRTFPAGRARRADLRLARRGRPRAPDALDPCRRRPAALRAARRHRPLAAAAAGRGRRAVRVQARRSAGTGGEDLVVDPLNPARAGDPFGENSVGRTFGYARPAWSQPRGAPAGRIEELARSTSRAFGETRGERVYLPAGHDPAARLSAGRRPRRRRLRHLRRPAGGARQPDRRRRHPAADRGAGADPRPAGRILRQPPRTPATSSRELLPALDARYAHRRRRRRERVLLGASLGAVASLATAFRYPGVFGGLVLKSGSFILDERKLARRPHPVFHRIARLVRALRRAPGAAGHPRLRLRPASSRGSPTRTARSQASCANAASMFCSRARGTATTGTTGATSCATGCAGCCGPGRKNKADGPPGPARPRGGTTWASAPSTSACRSGPTSAGRSPTRACSTGLKLDFKLGRDRLKFACERVTIEPFDLRQPVKYDLVIDRLTHWYSISREWIKKAIVLNDLYVYNNPWSIQANEKHTSYARDDAARAADPRDLDAAGQGLRARRRPRADAAPVRPPLLARGDRREDRLSVLHEALPRRRLARRDQDRRPRRLPDAPTTPAAPT